MSDIATLAHLDALYAHNSDPWKTLNSDYEHAKYEATLDALPAPSYASAIEVGCGTGALTRRLARRCRSLLAVDAVDAAVKSAGERTAALPSVVCQQMVVPDQLPQRCFDLIMLSEVLYFLSEDDVRKLARWCRDMLGSRDIVLVNFLGPTGHALSGAQAAELFAAEIAPRCEEHRLMRVPKYRIDTLRIAPNEPRQ